MQFDYSSATSGDSILLILRGIENLIFALRNFTLALALIFILIGGIQYATSTGDPEKAAKARSTITWAIVAILIAISLYSILLFLTNITGIKLADLEFTKPKDLFNFQQVNTPDWYKK